MSYNHNYELQLLDREYEKNRANWLSLGMSGADIEEMYRFDRAVINRDRSFYAHTSPIDGFAADDGELFGDDQSPLVHKHMERMSVSIQDEDVLGRFGWMTGMLNERLAVLMDRLSDKDRELLTALFADQLSQTEVAAQWGVSNAAISKRYKRVLRFLRDSLSCG